jgi:CheY-like chemotaxis protein
LAPVVLLLGAWSEGETRSGEPLAGVVRVYWHQWQPRFARQLATFERGMASRWSLPSTVTDEERLLWSEHRERVRITGKLAIVSQRREMGQWLADACVDLGLHTIRAVRGAPSDSPQVAAVLWDTFPGAGDAAELGTLRKKYGDVPVVAVTGFPRADDRQRLLAAGAAAVLSTPLLLDDLEWELARVLGPAASA